MPHSRPHDWLNEPLSDLREWVEAHEKVEQKREQQRQKLIAQNRMSGKSARRRKGRR